MSRGKLLYFIKNKNKNKLKILNNLKINNLKKLIKP